MQVLMQACEVVNGPLLESPMFGGGQTVDSNEGKSDQEVISRTWSKYPVQGAKTRRDPSLQQMTRKPSTSWARVQGSSARLWGSKRP